MISLCITGHSAAAIAAAQAALKAAGMAPARGLERDSHINFSSWHERVYQALEQSQPEPGEDDDSTPDAAPATMGRLWEQLANDLFLANIDTKVWGWADAKSLGLLDFWLELDAGTHFVLLATPPEQFLTEHLAQLAQEPGRSLQDLPIDSLMDQWQQAHQTMLHFALHHPKRCVLLLAELPLPADALVQAVKGAWAHKLKALRAEPADATALEPFSGTDSAAALLRHFATELCQAYPQAQSLQHEMASVALALPAPAIGAPQTVLDSVLSTVSLASQVPALLRQVPALERKAAEAEQQLPRLKEAEEEGELLLAQLHQVQEELERYYLRNTELEAELQAKAQEHEELSAVVHARNLAALARDAEAHGKAEALEQLKVLAQKHEALAAEREAQAQAKAEALERLEVLEHQCQALTAERDAETLAKTEALQEIDSLVHARNLVAFARHEERAQFEALDQQYQALSAELETQAQTNAQALEKITLLAQDYQGLVERVEADAQTKAAALQEIDSLVHARNLVAFARQEERAQFEALDQQYQALSAELETQAQTNAQALEQITLLAQDNQGLVERLAAETQAKTEALQEIDSLVHARNLVSVARHEERAQFEALDQQYQALSAELETQAQTNAQALGQITLLAQDYQGLVERVEADAQTKAAALEEVAGLAQEMASLSAQLDAETQAKSEALEEVDSLVHARNLVAADREEASAQALTVKEEYNYLLGQLQQVQEELERCYLRNKDLEAAAAQAGQRFSRMVSRKADGIDWESVDTEVESGPGGAQLRCRATQVAVAGKAWDALEFTAHMHQGALAFTFSRRPGAPAVLSRWPAGAGEQWTATVDEAGAAALKEISTSDWDLLHGLPRLLTQGLQQAKGPWPRGATAQHWLDAARATLPALQRHPMAVRVDALRLQANRVLAGREYLVLHAEQLTLAHKRFAALEFRLGCNLGPNGEFGQTARLEFFKGSAPATFEQWAPNVQDPAGDRLDLVFVFTGAMNLKDWAALSVNDRGLVLLLADQLPALLAELQTDAIRMTRPLRDWIALADRVRSFVRQRLDVTGVQQAVPDSLYNDMPLPSADAPRRARAAKPTPARKRALRAVAPAVTPAAKSRKK